MQKKFFDWVPSGRIVEGNQEVRRFTPGSGYFQIRLAEMFLRDRRHYWYGYIPMTITVSDFIYDDDQISVPIYIGNNLLKSIEKYVENEYVEYYNTNIIGPVPYLGSDVAFFLGLFRIQVSDLSLKLFDFIESLISSFDLSQLSSYLKIAGSVRTGLSDLLGIKEVQMQIGSRVVFNDLPGDPSGMREGYLLYVNSPFNQVQMDRLWVENDRLFTGESKRKLAPYQEHDYCLVKIVCRAKRNDYGILGFSQLFKAAQAEIFKNNIPQADQIFLSLVQKVSISPDLTQDHRFKLVQLYTANYEKQIEYYRKSRRTRNAENRIVRGPRASLDAPDVIKNLAFIAHKHRISKEAERGLLDIGANLDRVVGKSSNKADLTDQDLNNQLDELTLISQVNESTPTELVKAISLAMLHQA